jgi:hypothetical protein
MSFWQILNMLAWGMAGLIFLVMAVDFIRAEKEHSTKN